MNGLLLDTTVLIDLSRGNEQAAGFVEQSRETGRLLAVSAVSAMELVVGCRNKIEVSRARNLITEFSLLQMMPAISSQAYDWLLSYSKSHGLLIPDALIGAMAFVQQMELATDNVKDFQMLPGLQVWKPY
ncbi:MAG: type II toxin-antitoxin system VapC family toxin [Gammaproteobacteria bacterium]|nr:type II toxin-antitoxin system VapC family toxin [Gammaproteobacteria bacterium]